MHIVLLCQRARFLEEIMFVTIKDTIHFVEFLSVVTLLPLQPLSLVNNFHWVSSNPYDFNVWIIELEMT